MKLSDGQRGRLDAYLARERRRAYPSHGLERGQHATSPNGIAVGLLTLTGPSILIGLHLYYAIASLI